MIFQKHIFVSSVLLCFLAASAVMLANDGQDDEQTAILAAVDRVAPSVVRIETVGGRERVGNILLGNGPTTGYVVDPDGYIISSAFNFVNEPTSIFVQLPNGVRKAAKLVATDHSRMLVLLKIDAEKPLPVAEIGPAAGRRVGQWTIALGRAFDGTRPNLSVGILSALDRVWGKAIQTDAAVSPNNYGGPLIDIRGRVLGILVPLSPDASGEMAGVDWYDSGVGFAIPMEQVEQVLPRLKKGEDLFPGRMGIALKGQNLYTGEPTIATCAPKSPAATAGLKPDDRIVAIDGRKIVRSADLMREISRRYAGDTMRVTVQRGNKTIERPVTLVKELKTEKPKPEQKPDKG